MLVFFGFWIVAISYHLLSMGHDIIHWRTRVMRFLFMFSSLRWLFPQDYLRREFGGSEARRTLWLLTSPQTSEVW